MLLYRTSWCNLQNFYDYSHNKKHTNVTCSDTIGVFSKHFKAILVQDRNFGIYSRRIFVASWLVGSTVQ